MDIDPILDVLAENPSELEGDLLSNVPGKLLTQNRSERELDHLDLRRESSNSNVNVCNPIQAGAVVSKVEDIFENIANAVLLQNSDVVIRLKSRRNSTRQGSGTIVGHPKDEIEVRFPSRSPQEAWKFSKTLQPVFLTSIYRDIAVLLRILELSHEALVTGVIVTKRFLVLSLLIIIHSFFSIYSQFSNYLYITSTLVYFPPMLITLLGTFIIEIPNFS